VQLGRVVGNAVATCRHRSLAGQKLLLVQPLLADGRTPDGDPQLAVDCVGAGVGQAVMITSDGRYVRERVGDESTPLRWSIVGIRDT
jgi:ethanolamine utilization protein EutN